MKNLLIKKIETGMVEASTVPVLLDNNGIEWNAIACVNWAEYPYQPEVKFRAVHTGDSILLPYQVTEASVRAVALADDGRVWEDACVEFFLSPESNDFITTLSAIVPESFCCMVSLLELNARELPMKC